MKKVSRKKKVILGVAVFLLVLVSGGVIGVNYVFNKIMDSAIDIATDEPVQSNNVAVSSPIPKATQLTQNNQKNKGNAGDKSNTNSNMNSNANESSINNNKKLTKKQIGQLNKKGIAYDEKYGEKKIDSGAVGTAQYNDPKNKNWNVTSVQLGASVNKKDIEKFKENASIATKAQVVKAVMGRFSSGEINEMRQIAQGGITYPEKKRLHDIVYAKFNKSEIEDLMSKYNTYK